MFIRTEIIFLNNVPAQRDGGITVESRLCLTCMVKKEKPTFNGALPALRRLLWNEINSSTSEKRVDMI